MLSVDAAREGRLDYADILGSDDLEARLIGRGR
jgi:hypothetical protein